MGVFLAPRPVIDGLVVYLDANNPNSYTEGSTYVYSLAGALLLR